MRKFKYSDGDVVGNLEIKGLGGTSKSGTRLYSVLCLLCGSVTDKRLQTIEGAKSCGCMQSKRDRKVVGSGSCKVSKELLDCLKLTRGELIWKSI